MPDLTPDTSPLPAGPHLTTRRDLERHCRSGGKRAAYRGLLLDLGIDLELFEPLVAHPRLVLAEQPGNWLSGTDLIRYRLLRALIENDRFHASSGVLSLATDALTCRGLKRLFLAFLLHPELGPLCWLGASYLRRHRNHAYHALPIAGASYQRIRDILDICLTMLSSARVSPDAFATEVRGIFRGGVRSGLGPLLPASSDRRSLRELGARLGDYDLEGACQPLRTARRELRDGMRWVGYWDCVNGAFFGTRIGKLDPLFNRFLLTIADPVRMSRCLMSLCRHRADQPIAVAAIVTGEEKYRMVFFDPATEDFFYRPSVRRRVRIPWWRLRELAERGATGGPSGVLEYLLMAASGIYLVVDPGDGKNRFERLAWEIHRRYTGLQFPSITFEPGEGQARWDYLHAYHPEFESRSRATLDRFFGS